MSPEFGDAEATTQLRSHPARAHRDHGPAYLLVVQGPDPEKPGWILCQWIDVDDDRRPVFNVDFVDLPRGSTDIQWDGEQPSGKYWIRESAWEAFLGGGHWLT